MSGPDDLEVLVRGAIREYEQALALAQTTLDATREHLIRAQQAQLTAMAESAGAIRMLTVLTTDIAEFVAWLEQREYDHLSRSERLHALAQSGRSGAAWLQNAAAGFAGTILLTELELARDARDEALAELAALKEGVRQ